MEKKSYLGDGVYINDEGFQFKLHTQQGNEIYLGDTEVESFFRFIERTRNVKITVAAAE